jgi:fluoroacetyl-CoA thioesterase
VKASLRPGLVGAKRFIVEPGEAVGIMGPEVPPVLASAWMLWHMEDAAWNAVSAHLDESEGTVGVGFQFEHVAPCLVGEAVVATAELIAIDRRQLRFRIEARDRIGILGQGEHVRVVVDKSRFARRALKRADLGEVGPA